MTTPESKETRDLRNDNIERIHQQSADLLAQSNDLLDTAGDLRRDASAVRRMAGDLDNRIRQTKGRA
ncbi:MAG: hypothetical protein AAFN59_14125 [Pseudomonadota bacterium]